MVPPEDSTPCHTTRTHCDPRQARRARQQWPRRLQEDRQRRAIVQRVEQAHGEGMSWTRMAAVLQRSARTLRAWRDPRAGAAKTPELRGRRVLGSTVTERNRVIRFLHHVTGPAIGLPALRALFCDMPRCVLEHLLRRYRRVWRARYCPFGLRLTWLQPGRVWAMDFSEAPFPIDGGPRYIFAVRDLASARQLAWAPIAAEDATQVIALLLLLFRRYGAPLLIKCDNGAAFIAERLAEWLRPWGVILLFSPPRQPRYNGALERSNRTHKIYTAQQAASEGHPFQWRREDLEAARHLANEITRPWGQHGPTAQEAWDARTPITPEERRRFLDRLDQQRPTAAAELGLDLSQPLEHHDRARLDRRALVVVLEALGYVSYRRGSRITRRPPRPTTDEMEKRVAKHVPDAPPEASLAQRASALPPLLKHRPCVDNGRSAQAPSQSPSETRASQPAPVGAPASAPARPLEHPLPAPPIENPSSTPSRSLVSADGVESELVLTARKSVEKTLAPTARPPTIQAPHDSTDSTVVCHETHASAHGERGFTSWWRSLVTLLKPPWKAAKIM